MASELTEKGQSKDQIVGTLTQIFLGITIHEITHHEFNVRLSKEFGSDFLMVQCAEHEGSAFARQAIAAKETRAKKINFNGICPEDLPSKASLSPTAKILIDTETLLLNAAEKGKESFNAFVDARATKFSISQFTANLKEMKRRLSNEASPSTFGRKQLTNSDKAEFLKRIDYTLTFCEDPAKSKKLEGMMKAEYEKNLGLLAKEFNWSK